MANLKTISGTAKLKDGSPAFGTKVYLSTATGKSLAQGNVGGAIVNAQGEWSMQIPVVDKENRWLRAKDSLTGAEWNNTLKSYQNVYPIDFNEVRGTQEVQEVVVSVKRPEATKEKPAPKPLPVKVAEPTWWQKNWWWIVTSGAVLTTGLIVFIVLDKKKKNKKNKK